MKKRILAALLCAAMVVSVCACNNDSKDSTQNNGNEEPATPPTITSLATFDDLNAVLKDDYAITEEDIEEYFTSMLCSVDYGLIEVKDRDTVQAGDIVQVDYTGYLNDKAFDGGADENQIIDVSGNCAFDETSGSTGNTYIDKFSDGLIGAKIDTPVKHNVTFPTNYSNTDLAGKETTFEFNVDKIYIKATPDTVTDDYVKEALGDQGHTTIAGLYEYSKEELVASAVMNYAINNSKIDVSEEYLNERLATYEAMIVETSGGSYDFETLVQLYYGMTADQIRPYFLQYIKTQVTAEVVLAEIVKSKQLTVNEEEVNAFIKDVLEVNSSFTGENDLYIAIGYGDAENGKACLSNEITVKAYILEKYRASQSVTE